MVNGRRAGEGRESQFHASKPRFRHHYLKQAINEYMSILSLFKYVEISMKFHPSLTKLNKIEIAIP